MKATRKGLAALEALREQEDAKAAERDRPRAEWLSKYFPKELGNKIRVVFLQELDADAPGYNEENGLGTALVEHQAPGPKGYLRRALCTQETEGRCYACEKHAQNVREGWRQRINLYINVAVEDKDVALVLNRNFNSTFAAQLLEEARQEDSITDVVYQITKSGEGKQTNWVLRRTKEPAWDVSGIKPWDIDEVVSRNIEYDRQAEYFAQVYQPESEEKDEPATASDTSTEW